MLIFPQGFGAKVYSKDIVFLVNSMDLSPLLAPVPKVLAKKHRKVSAFFAIDELELQFGNGLIKNYERLPAGRGAVLAVPFDGTHFYLTSEYGCGFERYELGFVKGKIDEGEPPETAVRRELEEEIGFGCKHVELLKNEMTVAPGMMALRMYCFLCTDLYQHSRNTGDEPEPIRIIKVTADEAKDLAFRKDSPLSESRSIACLLLAMHMLKML